MNAAQLTEEILKIISRIDDPATLRRIKDMVAEARQILEETRQGGDHSDEEIEKRLRAKLEGAKEGREEE